jgi:HD-GYP domain-containing protein (c-di-GMP phosphodiesterase class II)
MLEPIAFLRPALDIPHGHHERWDGAGYPRGLQGTMIPPAARLFSVVDVWDSLRHTRPYKPAWSVDDSRRFIQSGRGTQFDPEAVDAFLALLDAGAVVD